MTKYKTLKELKMKEIRKEATKWIKLYLRTKIKWKQEGYKAKDYEKGYIDGRIAMLKHFCNITKEKNE